ncbi:TetR family transcriptional regulator [Robertmurraya korlensis]|uniref:TetR family transcriptional regulator n=1 Tax=Robertmurraya korlensis TaxID=519977 RepID=UPI00203DAFA1|nr:TetR family transcriptional regulator [Robertmurraya korlensis]MCM3601010.1 TetR family transcriptional regulator [Robertmurraya korlensis]
MAETRQDPRVMRTRKLIMDSFLKVSKKKDFKDIKIIDITTEATVNRATFYYHFMDKYDLREKLIKEDLMVNVLDEIDEEDELNEAMIIKIFLAMTRYLDTLKTKCNRNYQELSSTIEAVMKKELQGILYKRLLKQNYIDNEESLRMTAVMLSWAFYGAMLDWQANSALTAEDYIKKAMPNMEMYLKV